MRLASKRIIFTVFTKVYTCVATTLHVILCISAFQILPCCYMLLTAYVLLIPVYGNSAVCLFVPWLIDIWVISSLAIMTKTAMNILIQFLGGHMFSFILGKYQGVGFQGCILRMCLTLLDTNKLFSKVVVLF